MDQRHFYKQVINGSSLLIAHFLELVDAAPDQLCMIMGDTSRIASLGGPDINPTSEDLKIWTTTPPPLWASKTALFLLLQMPQKPTPSRTDEQMAWAYVWLRLREFESAAAARIALPPHLSEVLAPALQEAWADLKGQRLL